MSKRITIRSRYHYLDAGRANRSKIRHTRVRMLYLITTGRVDSALLRLYDNLINRHRNRSTPQLSTLRRRMNSLVYRRAHLTQTDADSSRLKADDMFRNAPLNKIRLEQ